ncbi:tape measure protein [Microbacterium phage Mabodamaca]|uniref:Tape measure protein n=1 Tax=Microbacterium phage Mabodamaca TaxID=3078574 RepID=A0AA96NFT9_9CAUD|nr:tape measure protein [Microbacterium phage Mabodamaca]
MAENVGYATLNVIPSAKGFGKTLKGQVNPALDSTGKEGGSLLGKGISTAFDKATKLVLGSIGAIGGGIAGLAVYGGFSRALKLDEARTKLTALNYTTKESEAITQSALASVKGTAFGLDSAVSSAVGLLAAGVKPGQELTGVLTTISNTAALAGTSMDEMGSIFGKIAANGKVTTEEMNQLADRGVPIWQYLGESIGVNNTELRKMIETGQVTSDMFYNGLGPAVEGVATVMGTSFKGMLMNAKASLGRLGALFAGPILESGKGLLGVFTELSDSLGAKLAPYAEKFGQVITSIDWAAVVPQVAELARKAYDLVTSFSPAMAIFNALKPVFPQLAAAILPLGAALTDALIALLPSLLPLLEMLTSLLTMLLPPITGLLTGIIGAATGVLQFVAANAEWLTALGIVAGVIAGVVAAVSLFQAVQLGLVAATYGAQGAMLVAGTSMKVYTAAMTTLNNLQKVATAAQWLWNAALTANPIGIIITAIAALVAGLVYFFTQTELGRTIWEGFMTWLGEAWTNIVNVATTVWGALSTFFTDLFTGIGEFFTTTWTAISTFFTDMWTGIVTTVTTVWEAIVAFLTPIFEVIANIIRVYIEIWVNVFIVFAAVLKTIWDGIVAVVTFVWEAIVAFLTPIVQGIADFIGATMAAVSAAWDAVWTAISAFFTAIWEGIVAFLTPIITGIQNTITAVVNAISAVWNAVWGAISSFFATIWQGIVDFLTPIINRVSSVISAVINGIKSTWSSIWGGISSFFSDTWNNIVSTVSRGVDEVLSTVEGIYEGVVGFFSDVGSWLISAGGDLVRGFWEGIGNMGDWLMNQITGFFDGVIGWAKDTLGIHSPSRVFRELGGYTGEGFALGLGDQEGAVAKSALGLAQAAQDAVDGYGLLSIGAEVDGVIPDGGLIGANASLAAALNGVGQSTSLEYHQHGGQGLTAEQELIKAARRLQHVP